MGFLSSFYKQPKPRQFNYRPRYYDPAAEERERRKQEVLGVNYKEAYKTSEEKAPEDDYNPGQYIRQMRERRGIVAERRRGRKRTNTIMAIAMVLGLLYIAWWVIGFF